MNPPRRPSDGDDMRRRKSWHPPSTSTTKRRRIHDPLADISWIINEARQWSPLSIPPSSDNDNDDIVYSENDVQQQARLAVTRDEHGRRVRSRTAQSERASSPEADAIPEPALTGDTEDSDDLPLPLPRRRRTQQTLPTLRLPPRNHQNNTITQLSSSPTSSPRHTSSFFSTENASSRSHLNVQGSSPMARAHSDSSVYTGRNLDLSTHDRSLPARLISPSLRGPSPLMRRSSNHTLLPEQGHVGQAVPPRECQFPRHPPQDSLSDQSRSNVSLAQAPQSIENSGDSRPDLTDSSDAEEAPSSLP